MIKTPLIYIALAAVPLMAQAEEAASPWDVEVDLGIINTTGNTETSSFQGKVDAKQKVGVWKNQYIVSGLYKKDQVLNDLGEKSKETTAEKYFGSLKSAYQLGEEQSYLFGYTSYTNDKFGAYETYTTVALGYGDWIFSSPKVQWFVEAGPGYFEGKKPLEEGAAAQVTESGAMLRAASELVWKISDNSQFKQTLSVEAAADNTRTISESSLAASVTHAMKMKVGFSIANDSKVTEGKERTDTTTFVNLVYSF